MSLHTVASPVTRQHRLGSLTVSPRSECHKPTDTWPQTNFGLLWPLIVLKFVMKLEKSIWLASGMRDSASGPTFHIRQPIRSLCFHACVDCFSRHLPTTPDLFHWPRKERQEGRGWKPRPIHRRLRVWRPRMGAVCQCKWQVWSQTQFYFVWLFTMKDSVCMQYVVCGVFQQTHN